MVKFDWSTFWIVLVSCFGVMIFSYLIDPYFLGVIMIVLAISITGVWCISLLRRILEILEKNNQSTQNPNGAEQGNKNK